MSSTPVRRLIVLGASNVALSFATIVQTARQTWGGPVEILAAMGHGRSFGQDSRVLGRKISGIFPCALWQELGSRPALPTAAVVTDIGNDILYGVPADRLLNWVELCLDRLAEASATTIVTELPLASLRRLSAARFRFFRKLFFPRSAMTLSAALDAATAVNEGLIALGRARKLSVIPVSDAWYGFDPIHLRRALRLRAWSAIMSSWRVEGDARTARRATTLERAYLACLAPHERYFWGVRRCARQPSGRLRDGTTISLY